MISDIHHCAKEVRFEDLVQTYGTDERCAFSPNK